LNDLIVNLFKKEEEEDEFIINDFVIINEIKINEKNV